MMTATLPIISLFQSSHVIPGKFQLSTNTLANVVNEPTGVKVGCVWTVLPQGRSNEVPTLVGLD